MNNKLTKIMLAMFFLIVSGVQANGMEFNLEYRFDPPELEEVDIDVGGGRTRTFTGVQIYGLHKAVSPGEPVLPYRTARVLLPPGQEVEEIVIEAEGGYELPLDYMIEPGQLEYHSESEEYLYIPPEGEIYDSDEHFPSSHERGFSIHALKGYRILQINLCPVLYFPAEQKLLCFDTLRVTVLTTDDMFHSELYRESASDREWVSEYVDNPEAVVFYEALPHIPEETAALPYGSYDMVIITDSALESSFKNYASWKTKNRGVKTLVYKMGDIKSNYAGKDVPEKIRNFITDAYKTWKIDYVLLGGDVDIVPERRAWAKVKTTTGWTIDEIPCDLYYGGLDGNWDTDGDGTYGEYDEYTGLMEFDLTAEVHVGRVPVSTVGEFTNFYNKVQTYEQSTLSSYRCKVLLLGKKLSKWNDPKDIWGGDFKDDVESKKLPAKGLTIQKLYDKSGPPLISTMDVVNALNASQHIVNVVSHGSYLSFCGITTVNVDSLTNADYSFVYAALPCKSARFIEVDAIGEHFIRTKHGAFAYIGNSAYGLFYKSGTSKGSAHKFELEVYDALFNEKKVRIGSILSDAKDDIANAATSGKGDLWTCYSVNLLGDPSTPIRIGPDLLVRDNNTDNGSIPSSLPWWKSPDIRVDQPPYGGTKYEDPRFGVLNHVYVTVHNKGCLPAENLEVRLYWADPAGGIPFSSWKLIGGPKTIPLINGASSVEAPVFHWTPTGTAIGHRCLLAMVKTKEDPISTYVPRWDNNIGQRNVNIVSKNNITKPNTFFVNPVEIDQEAERNLVVQVIDGQPGIIVILRIPFAVEIGKGESDTHIIETPHGWEVIVDPPVPGDPVVVPRFNCMGKEMIELEIHPPPHYDHRDFTVRIFEEIDGEPIGGIDYNIVDP